MKTKTKRPKTVSFRDVSRIAMVAGNEKRFSVIIHEGVCKRWVGFGWVEEEKATTADYAKYPTLK